MYIPRVWNGVFAWNLKLLRQQYCRGSPTAFSPWLLPAVYSAMWLIPVTCGLLFLSSALWGKTTCAGEYFALGFAFFFFFPFNVHARLCSNEESSGQRNTLRAWRKKDFLVPCGIWYCSLRHKGMEESLSLTQISLEETAHSALWSASCLTTVLILVPYGWIEMKGARGASQLHGQCDRGGAKVGGRALVSAPHCSGSSAEGNQGTAITEHNSHTATIRFWVHWAKAPEISTETLRLAVLSLGCPDRGRRRESDGLAAGWFLRRCWVAAPSV